MTVASSKVIGNMVDSETLFITKINKASIAPPVITMNDCCIIYASFDSLLQCSYGML